MPRKRAHTGPTSLDFMMPNESTNVFVSYSHADASLVAPVVKLLRVNKSLVFQDIDDIQPGRRWRSEIAKALAESHLVVVFWCDHASRSDEVSKEWKVAIDQEKDLLPLLLDATPLPPELGEFQWIDFRATVGANHSSIDSSDNAIMPSPPSPRAAARAMSVRWLSLTGLATALGIAVVLSLFTLRAPQPEDPTPLPLPASAEPLDFVISTLLLLGVVFTVTACLVWLLRRRSKRGISVERARRHPGKIERRIASELEVEILRRAALRRDGGA
jgi:TIR domain-containing protein